jgi:hypothetical protein
MTDFQIPAPRRAPRPDHLAATFQQALYARPAAPGTGTGTSGSSRTFEDLLAEAECDETLERWAAAERRNRRLLARARRVAVAVAVVLFVMATAATGYLVSTRLYPLVELAVGGRR